MDNLRTATRGYIPQDFEEGGESIVADLLPVPHLHPAHVQRFEADDGVLPAEFLCELPVEILPLVCDAPLEPCHDEPLLLVVPALFERAFPDRDADFSVRLDDVVVDVRLALSGQAFLLGSNLCAVLLEEAWHIDIISFHRRDKDVFFEPEVEPDALTQSWHDFVLLLRIARQENEDVACGIPLDRDCLDLPLDFT